MRIGDSSPIRGTDKTGKKKSSSNSSVDFTEFLSGSEETSDTSGTAPVAAPNNFLFLQEISDEDAAKQQAFKQGKDMIAALEDLHRNLLLGTVPTQALQRIQALVDRQRQSNGAFIPPELADLLNEIELRAAVELAKLGY